MAAVLFSVAINAQQWNGNNNTTDLIHRTGSATIGDLSQYTTKLQVLGNVNIRTISNSIPSEGFQDTYFNSLIFGNPGKNITNFHISRYDQGLNIFPSRLEYYQGFPLDGWKYTYHPTFFIANSTKIGIGTSSVDCTTCTDYRLFVKDGIRTEKVKVDIAANNGWADYVFKKDYKLMPLEEVESFINKNGHLPEVPSEKEAIEKGIELKAMNILLLKKVEELTLYTLQQQKSIDEQNKRIELLEKKLNEK